MDVIPAIDILQGRCVRLYQGDYAQSEIVAQDPLTQAQLWVDQGASRLHLVDLDGAKTGEPSNLEVIRQMAQTLSVPIQVGGGIRSLERAKQVLESGVDRVILGTVAVEDPDLVVRLCQQFPGRIIVGIDAKQGQVAIKGWIESTPMAATELVERVCQQGAAAIIYTDIQRDGTLQGPNLDQLRQIASIASVPVIASGGISSVKDLLSVLSLSTYGVTGVIVGKALYSGAITLPEAMRAVGPNRWQDVTLPEGEILT